DGEGPHGHAEGGGPVGGIAEEPAETGTRGGGLKGVGAAAFGLAHEKPEGNGDENPGECGDVEGDAPAEVVAKLTTHEVAESSADGDGDVEDAQDAVAVLSGG